VCQYGTYFLSLGVKPHDVVAIYLQNAPEFMFVWLGLLSIGAAPAMINWNLGANPLVHCIKISGAKLLIVDEEPACLRRIEQEKKRIEEELQVQITTLTEGLKVQIAASEVVRPDDSNRDGVVPIDPGALFYTSGTTGMPKLFPFTVGRIYTGSTVKPFPFPLPEGPDGAVCYDCMPIYHGTGGVTALLCMLCGITLAIGKKFSVSQFWDDIRDSRATFFIYVGETARYLLAAPPSPLDKQHRLVGMYGNGLRPDVWQKFRDRFGVAEVLEFFASTEGVFGLYTFSRNKHTANSVGLHGAILRQIFKNTWVPVETDLATGDIIRDPETGFAKRKNYEEGGEIICRIPDLSAWPGYWRSSEATAKKLARDVFEKGDLYYRTGDALRRNSDGLWFFLDRLGDTFRWKSENVSTAEVAEHLGRFPGVLEANVYGVSVPGHEGRAGCAALTLEPSVQGTFDWRAFATFAKAGLPRYAVPVFIRVMNNEVGELATHNNKQNKLPLRDEGIDPRLRGTKVKDGKAHQILWIKGDDSEYRPFSEKDWHSLVAGQAKL
jgi:acyl-CoA synthetase (AMP-forming)/AMP-acid ligase II